MVDIWPPGKYFLAKREVHACMLGHRISLGTQNKAGTRFVERAEALDAPS